MALPEEAQTFPENMNVRFSGIGKINATIGAFRLRGKKHVFNLGSVGSKSLPIGTLVECTKFEQLDFNLSAIGIKSGALISVPGITSFPKVTCGTSDSFITDWAGITCDVVDMEAYAIATVCSLYKIKFTCIKYVTDNANETSAKDWHSSLKQASEALYQAYLRIPARAFNS